MKTLARSVKGSAFSAGGSMYVLLYSLGPSPTPRCTLGGRLGDLEMSMKLVGSMLLVAGLAAAAQGDIVRDLGGGWEAIISESQADVLDVVADGNSPIPPGTLVIEKFAEFARVGSNGAPEGLTVTFRQIAADSATSARIVITDEVLINNLAQAWVGFQMSLTGAATWNQPATSAASRAPFTNLTYSNAGKTANFSGGSVAAGQTWFPGLASGGLRIDVDLSSGAPVTFSLTEVPVIPTPGAAALATLGGVMITRRRRA